MKRIHARFAELEGMPFKHKLLVAGTLDVLDFVLALVWIPVVSHIILFIHQIVTMLVMYEMIGWKAVLGGWEIIPDLDPISVGAKSTGIIPSNTILVLASEGEFLKWIKSFKSLKKKLT